MPFQYHVREITAETSAEDFVTHFVHVEKFLPFCQQCGSYNTRWTCPPFDFDPMTIWRSCTGLRLYARILQSDTPEQPLDVAVAALKQEKRLYRQELQRWERETPGSQMLLAGTCDQCETCEKVQGHPCGRPELLRYSIEALGGDVEGCLQHYFHLPIRPLVYGLQAQGRGGDRLSQGNNMKETGKYLSLLLMVEWGRTLP